MCSALASKFPLQENLSPNEDVEITKGDLFLNIFFKAGLVGSLFAFITDDSSN